MGKIREVDAISDAIIATEREIAGEAWGNEETDALDDTGDRSLEAIGEGLEGQHEAEDEDEAELSESEEEDEGEEESEDGEDEGEVDEQDPAKGEGKDNEPEPKPDQQQQQRQPEGRVPPGKLREANEARRLAEAERDQLKGEIEALKKAPGDNRAEIDALKVQVSTLTQLLQGQSRQPPAKTEEPAEAEVPDIFENPKGFTDHLTGMVQKAVAPLQQQLAASRVETSMAIAHGTHKGVFEEAFTALNGLDPKSPDDRATVQRIYNSSNPGEELVKWHKRNTALARVGDDPSAYEERIRQETRAALLKDPEFRKQLVADMRGEAAHGENGAPRTQTRLPKSLNRQSGSNLGSERMDHRASDDSEQGVADAAWR